MSLEIIILSLAQIQVTREFKKDSVKTQYSTLFGNVLLLSAYNHRQIQNLI